MVYSHEYDTRYDPAMPAVDVEVGLAGRNGAVTLTALVDSGADATLIPLRELQQVGVQQLSSGYGLATEVERKRGQFLAAPASKPAGQITTAPVPGFRPWAGAPHINSRGLLLPHPSRIT